MTVRRLLFALVAFTVAAAATPRRHAQAEARVEMGEGIRTYNTYKDRYVWITIYDNLKTRHLDYGCVAPKQSRLWTNREIRESYHTRFYVRGQVMETSDCKGTEYCDTTGEHIDGGDVYINTNRNVSDPKKQCFWDIKDWSRP